MRTNDCDRPRAVFPDCTSELYACLQVAGSHPDLIVNVGKPSALEFATAAADVAVVAHFQTKIDAALLSALPRLRTIVFFGTGIATWIDLAEAARRRITVRPIRNYADRTVAEHALALILACGRRIVESDREVRAGLWRVGARFELTEKTLGIVGLGGVGAELAHLAKALGMRVIGWNRSGVPPGVSIELRDLNEVFAEADITSLHLALNDETRGIIDRSRIGLMPQGAVLVNTARGALLDEAALADAIASGQIAAAGLDVFAAEPLAPDHPLRHFENVIFTAHSGWASAAATRRLATLGLAAIRNELDTLSR